MAQYGGEHEVRIPEVEVLVAAAESDVAVVAFYVPKSPHDEVEIVATIDDVSTIGAVRAILQMALHALNQPRWNSLDELDTRTDEDEARSPFVTEQGSEQQGS